MAREKASAWLAALLLGMAAAASGEEKCPPVLKGEIEKLLVPFKDTGDTSKAKGSIGNYDSPTCRIPNESYGGGEAVYEVRLNPGNEVSFFLDVQGNADLVLALVSACGKGTNCYSSSADFIGSGDEEIPAAKYPPGIYYLYVDSATGALGGPYELTVRGVNPTPDLLLKVDAPAGAFAGNLVTYKLSLTNRGRLAADDVEIVHTLPKGMALGDSPDCSGGRVTFEIEEPLGIEKTVDRQVVARICPGFRGSLTATAEAKARQGSPALPVPTTIEVTGQSDLSLHMTSSAASVVAGEQLTYTFTIHNAGPSDATGVKVEDTLSDKETFADASGWECSGTAPVTCGPLEIPAGGTVMRSITVNALSSALQPLVNRATVRAAEAEPGCKRRRDCGPNSDFVETRVERKTDLSIELTQDPAGEIALGDGFSYVLKVVNKGPSDSSGAKVVLQDGKGKSENRLIGPLRSGGDDDVKILVKTSPDGLEEQISATATVEAKETDPDKNNNSSRTLETTLKIVADLSLESEANLTEVCAGGLLEYTVTVVNEGPSNYRGGEISGKLSKGLSFVSSPDGCEAGDDARTVKCKVPPLEFGEKHPVRIAALVAHTETEVWVPGMGDKDTKVLPDLLVSLSADSPVVTGEDLKYTVKVENRGPSDAEDVKVKLELPSGIVPIGLGDIPAGKSKSGSHTATAPTASGTLTARASLIKPARCGNTAEATTTVTDADGVALALTMKADAQAVAVGDTLTYTIDVSNQGSSELPNVTITSELPPKTLIKKFKPEYPACESDSAKLVCPGLALPAKVEITVQVLPGAQTPLKNTVSLGPAPALSATIETPILPFRLLLPFFEVDGRQDEVTTLLSLRNLGTNKIGYSFLAASGTLEANEMATIDLRDVFLSISGYATINSDPPDASLDGDFVRVDPTPGTASGGLLVRATEMCREWSVRFLNGGPLETGTDFLFLAPGNGEGPPVVTGRVFNEKGQYVQELEIPNQEESFRIRTRDLGLLANFGSIEWTFREGLVGHVAAVHRQEGKDEVAVPGHCRRGAVPSDLILPFFLADPGTTLLTVRNEHEAPVEAMVSIFSSDGTPAGSQTVFNLAGHEIRTLRLEGGVAEGYARVDLPPTAEASGDFLLLDPLRARAGGALIRTSQLCRCWNVRYENGSLLLFYEQDRDKEMGKVDLRRAPDGQGAIEQDFGEHALGYAAALLTGSGTEGGHSVLVPGLCHPCP